MVHASFVQTKGVKVNELNEALDAFIGQAWLRAVSGSIIQK